MNPRVLPKRFPITQSLSRFSSAAAVCAALAMAGGASAASYQWDPQQTGATTGASGGAGTWNTTGLSWFGGAAPNVAWPNTGDTAVFGGTGGVVSLGGAITANVLQFGTGGYTVDNGGTAANTLTLTGTGAAITVTNAADTATISAVIAGSTAWSKTGAGTLALTGANTFTGRLTINDGTVAATAANNLGAGPITLDGGTLALNQTAQLTLGAAQIITVGAGGGTIDNAVAQKLLLNTTGGLIGSGTLTRNASANGSSLSNTFQISVANTGFTGAVILNGGVTEVSANGLGTGATAGNTITVNSGAELVANNSTMANALILNGGIIGGDGGNSTFSGAITVNGATSVRLGDFYQNTNRNLTITGNLSGNGALTTINNGNTATNATGQILTLNPTSGNNSGYTGALNVSAGNNVVFSTANALTGGTVAVNSNATQVGGVGVGFDFGATVPAFTNVRTGTTDGGVFGINTALASTTSLDMSTLGGGGMFLGSQTSGTYTSTTLTPDNNTFRLGGGTGTLMLPNATLTGANDLVIGDSRANGNGTVVLGGANTFTGSVSVANGTLIVGTINSVSGGTASSNLGAPTTVAGGTINFGSAGTTGTLRYTGAGEITDRVINLAGTTGGGVIEQAGTGALKFTSNFTTTGAGSKTLTLLGSTAGTGEIAGAIVDNSATNKTSLTKAGTGTWTLSGANTYSGATTVNGGTLALNGETGSLNSTSTLAVNTGGTFSYLGKSTGSSQTLGALTVSAGQGTVSSTYGGSGTTSLKLASLARTAGASVNFVSSGGANGTSNLIAITGQSTSGFINQGTFFNGTDFAYNNGTGATGYLRAPVYGTDANFSTSSGGTTLGVNSASTHVQLTTANVTAQTTASIATLKINGARTLAISSGQTLTVSSGGILATGGASTISGGTVTSGSAEMSIRTDAAGDSLTISSVLGGSGGLTKSGAGTLTLSNTSNTFTGNIFVNGGTLAYAGTSGSADQVALGAGAKSITLTGGATLSPTASSNPTSGTKSFVIGAGGGTFNVANTVTLQLDDANQFSGTGDLTVTGAGTGTVFLNNQTFNFTGNVFVNSGTLKLGANSGVLGSSTGRTITIGSGGVVDAQIANLPLGLVLNGTGISSGGALVNSSTTAASFTGPVTINSGATIGGSGPLTLSGNVSGSGLTKVGSGLLTLSGSNTYGNTTINAGGVQFNSLTAFGASGASVSAAAGTTVAAGYAIDQAFLGRISTQTNAFTVGLGANSSNNLDFGAAGLTNASLGATGSFTYTGTLTPNGTTYRLGGGGGTLTLSNTNAVTGANDLVVNGNTILASSNDYTGTTTVSAGTLSLNATSSSSAITVASGATLQLGTGGTTGSLGTSTLTNNGTLAYNHSDNVTTDVFTGTGAITQANGTSTLTINSATTAISRLFVSAGGGTVDLGSTNRTIGVDGGNSIQMLASGTGTINASGGAVITLGVGASDIGAVSGGTLVINPVIQGTNGIDIYNAGSGTVVFNGANTYTGGTNVQSGTLSVGSLNSVATDVTRGTVHSDSSNLGAPTTVANGTINIGSGSSTTTTATLKYTGAGEITDRVINLAGTTNGATIDQSGTGLLKFTSNLTSGAGSKTLTLQGSTAGAGEIAGAIVDNSGSNKTAITKAGTGTWTLSGTNTYTGATTVNAGTLALTGTLGATAITVASAGTFTQSSTGVIGGATTLTTSGTTTLSGTNTFTGATAVNGGTLALNGTLGTTAITVGTAGTFTESSTGVISGAATLTTSGTTTLSGTNTFTGDVKVSAGPLTITNSAALGTGPKTITVIPATNPTSNPSLRLDGSAGDITLPANLSFTTSFDTIGASGSILEGGAIINVAGNNTIAGNFSIPTGGGGVTFRSNAGTLTLSGNITPSATSRSVYLRGDGNGVISGVIANGSTTTGLPVTKDVGSGTWTLSGTNTYTGPTTVSAGTLAIAASGSISGSTQVNVGAGATLDVSAFNGNGNGGFSVGKSQTFVDNGTINGDLKINGDLNAGGTLSGAGIVTGSVTASANSTISPGSGIATLSVGGNFSLNATAHLALEIGTTAAIGSDRLSVASGNVTLGGSLDITLLPTFADNVGDTFTIILNGGGSAISGLFSNVTPLTATTGLLSFADGHQFVVNYAANADGGAVANDVALTVAAVPEPSALVAMLGGTGMLLGMRRRKGSR